MRSASIDNEEVLNYIEQATQLHPRVLHLNSPVQSMSHSSLPAYTTKIKYKHKTPLVVSTLKL